MKFKDNKIRNRVEDSYSPSNFFEAVTSRCFCNKNGPAVAATKYPSICG